MRFSGLCLVCSFLINSLTLQSRLKPFELFHSNMGEIIRIRTEGKRTEILSPTPDANDMEEEEDSSMLSDDELDELLFGDWFEDDLIDPVELNLTSPEWFHSLNIESGLGYSDNPLYGNYNVQDSAYGSLGLESFSLSQGSSKHEMLWYLYAEGKKFTDLGEDDVSGLILGQLDYSFSPLQSSVAYGFQIQHTYYDQAMDFSEIGLPSRMKVTSNRSAFIPHFNWRIGEKLNTVSKLGIERQTYRKIEDESIDLHFSQKLSGDISDSFEWSSALEIKQINYKDRTAKTADGTILNGKLESLSLEASLGLAYTLPFYALEKTGMKVGHKSTRDKRGTYYDYDRLKIALSQGIEFHSWSFDASSGYGNTSYTSRKLDNGETLERTNWNINLGISRSISDNWRSFLRWNHEKENSNDSSFSYSSNFWTIGMNWER